MRRTGLAEAAEIAAPSLGLVDGRCRGLLLVSVARDQPAGAAVGQGHEAGAVDSALGHPAPLIRRAEVGARSLDGVVTGTGTCDGACPFNKCVLPDPTGIVVRSPNAAPAVARFLDDDGLVRNQLRHLLGRVVRLSANRRDVDRADERRRVLGRRRLQVAQRSEPCQSLALELPDPLSGQVELVADRLERPRLALEAEAELQDPALALRQRVERAADALLAQR